MCGIVGLIARPGCSVDVDALRRMDRTIMHRGPDGDGEHVADGVGFSHRRLAIIDLAERPAADDRRAASCWSTTARSTTTSSCGRRSGSGATSSSTESDTEVLLQSYLEYGLDCLHELNGMFAFVLHDTGREQVVAARDHFGIKPLYYCVTESAILFASEIKALLAHPEVEARVDDVGLQDYLTFQHILDERTLFAGIRELPPGSHLVIDLASGELTTTRYWEPSFEIDTAPHGAVLQRTSALAARGHGAASNCAATCPSART